MGFGSGAFGTGTFGGFAAGSGILGLLPNPLTLPELELKLGVDLSSLFDMGDPDVDKSAQLDELIPDIDYHAMYSIEHSFDASSAMGYKLDTQYGLYAAYPVYEPAYSFEFSPGIWGYLVALFIECTEGSCILLNNRMQVGAPPKSTQYIPYPMEKGDFLFWSDPTEPLMGIDEDGVANSAMGLLGIQATTDNGVRLTVHSFYKFVEYV